MNDEHATHPVAPPPPPEPSSEHAVDPAAPPAAPAADEPQPAQPAAEPATQPMPAAPPMAPAPGAGVTPPAQPPVGPAPVAAAAEPRRGASLGAVVIIATLVALVVSLIAGVAGGFLGARLGSGVRTLTPARVTVVPSTTSDPVVAAAAAAVPSVVNIDVTSGTTQKGGQNGLPNNHPTVPSSGNGSGVAYKAADGGGTYIITNNHVVADAATIKVKSPGGDSWTGTLVGRDPETDIAVVKIPGTLPGIQTADSDKIVVGETVVAIGSPYGLEHTVTSGIVSAIGRSLPDFSTTDPGTYPLVDVIQTDAAINPGNSGGALVNKEGKLVGINTAIYSDSGASGGIGFAVPSKTAMRAADQLIKGGKVQHPFLGVVGQTVTPELQKQKGLKVSEGAYVEEFSAGSTAQKGGMKVGDVIVEVAGSPVTSMDDLILQVRRQQVGSTIDVVVDRGGQKVTLKVEIGEKPASLTSSSNTPSTTATSTP